jgi:hypothetical protein
MTCPALIVVVPVKVLGSAGEGVGGVEGEGSGSVFNEAAGAGDDAGERRGAEAVVGQVSLEVEGVGEVQVGAVLVDPGVAEGERGAGDAVAGEVEVERADGEGTCQILEGGGAEAWAEGEVGVEGRLRDDEAAPIAGVAPVAVGRIRKAAGCAGPDLGEAGGGDLQRGHQSRGEDSSVQHGASVRAGDVRSSAPHFNGFERRGEMEIEPEPTRVGDECVTR